MRLPGEDEAALRDACREVLAKHSTSERVRLIAESTTGHDERFWELAADLGWPALAVPEDFGGLGGSVSHLCVVAEELGRSGQPSPLVQTLAVGSTLARFGAGVPAVTELLEGIASGSVVATWTLGQPDRNEDLRLVQDSDGTSLRGRAEFVPDGRCATHLAVRAEGPDGPALVVVPIDDVRAEPMRTLDITRRYSRLALTGVRVDAHVPRLPAPSAEYLFELGVVLQCAESTGLARRLLDMTVTYAKQRSQFGRPIGGFQAIKHRIADMLVETEGCRVATRDAAEALDTGVDVMEAVSVAKSWVGRGASFVASHALQIHGGIGFSWEHDLHLFLRRAKVNELLLGSPSWHDERLYGLLSEGVRDEE